MRVWHAAILLLLLAAVVPQPAGTIAVTSVPLFTFRCRRLPLPGAGTLPKESTWYVGQKYYGTANAVKSNGSGWSDLGNFTADNRAKAAATYQNSYMKSWFAMTTNVAVFPVSSVTNVTCQLRFTGRDASSDPAAGTTTVSGRLYPDGECGTVYGNGSACWAARDWRSCAWLGLVMTRSDHSNHSHVIGAPVVQTMRAFNEKQYWPMLRALPPIPKRPTQFPVMDYFSGGDSDLDAALDAVDALSLLGLHGLMANFQQPDIASRLRARGHDIISGGTFVLGAGGTEEHPGLACVSDVNSSCNFHVWDHKHAKDADLINGSQIRQWAKSTAAPYLQAGYRGKVSMLAQADEPAWSWDASVPPVQTSPRVRGMWEQYLMKQGLTPAAFGHSRYPPPIGRYAAGAGRGVAAVNCSQSALSPLEARKLYYWSGRFSSYSASEYMRNTTLALQAAFGQKDLGVYANYYNWAGQLFEPSPGSSNDSASMSFDWFEAAKLKAGSTLWTEDWFTDLDSYHWSFLASKLRSAAQDSPYANELNFAGYTVPRKSGYLEGGLQQKMMAQVGGGAKALRNFIFGPEYAFPNNCYSDNANLSRIVREIATVAGTIGAVEDLLLVAKRPRARVAIVAPRSSCYWDAWEGVGAKGSPPTLVGVTSSLMALSEVYTAEVFALWKMLTLEFNIPVDFISEDQLAGFISNPTIHLALYSSIFITQPNLPIEALYGATAWVQEGANRTLLLSPFAGRFDAYNQPVINQPDIDLLSLTGVGCPLRPQNYYGLRWKLASEGACYNPPNSWFCAVQNGTTTDGATAFTAWGVWGDLSINGKVQNTTVVATYDGNMESPLVDHLSFFSFYDYNASAQSGWTTNGCETQTADAIQGKLKYNTSTFWGQLDWSNLINFAVPARPKLRLPALRAVADGLRPLLGNGTIIGVYVGDEVSCGSGNICPGCKVTFPLLLNITAELRAALPTALLYMNDCVDAWPYIPPDLDLVGMDRYLLSSHGMDEVSGTKAYYESAIFPKLAPHQRAMIVPGLVGCSVNSSYGRSVPKEDQEQALLQKLEGYYSWAKSDPRIAGINSWHFNHYTSNPDGAGITNPYCDWLYGCVDFPVLLARLKEIGADIIAAAGKKSSPPAITSTKVGGGTIMQTGFWAGVSWFYSDISMVSPPHEAVKSPWAPAKPLAEMLVGFMAEADQIGPVTTNVTRVETPLLLAPDGTGALITLLDWRRTDPHAELCLEASPCVLDVVYVETIAMLSFKNVTSVEVVANGKLAPLPFQQLQKESLTDPPGAAKGSTVMQIKFTVPLQYAAIVQLKGRPL